MEFDKLAKDKSDRVFQVWVQNLLRNSPEELAGKLASGHCPGTPVTALQLSNGAFSVCYRVTYENGLRVLVRFTALGRVIAEMKRLRMRSQ
ncbi:Phosphotransferase enzyme family protein [Aspergillus sclerotialis]|uniref:Phosphotransferase enzyme family protein n=1 Tax=Aspergillus sclerotialis TaxID=2070753 RepID=A0A3A2ZBI5_9EURO|nr:Phosphotransferase enzyme family protein [Aspergillus sclerotialis]